MTGSRRDPGDRRAGLLLRVGPSLAGLVAFAIVSGLTLSGARSAYTELLTLWGVPPFRYPFLDLDANLAAWDCARRGIDVIVTNPCDVMGRGYVYSPLWLSFDWIALGRQDRAWMGAALSIAFLLSLSALPPALSMKENLLRIVASLSTSVAFSIERGNIDLFIFLLVVAALPLLVRSPLCRIIGYGLLFIAGAVKYYPYVLFGLVTREKPRLGLAIIGGTLIGLCILAVAYGAQIREGLPHIPMNFLPFTGVFGARNLPLGTFLTLRDITGSAEQATFGAAAVSVLTVFGAVWLMLKLWRRGELLAALERIDEPRRLALVAGALLVADCFFLAQTINYRAVFLLLVLPGLGALSRDGQAPATARAAKVAAGVAAALMWAEALRLWIHLAWTGRYPAPLFAGVMALDQPVDVLAWAARELAWWALIAFLTPILFGLLVVNPLLKSRRLLLSWRARRPGQDVA